MVPNENSSNRLVYDNIYFVMHILYVRVIVFVFSQFLKGFRSRKGKNHENSGREKGTISCLTPEYKDPSHSRPILYSIGKANDYKDTFVPKSNHWAVGKLWKLEMLLLKCFALVALATAASGSSTHHFGQSRFFVASSDPEGVPNREFDQSVTRQAVVSIPRGGWGGIHRGGGGPKQ